MIEICSTGWFYRRDEQMTYCQVASCDRQATSKCSGGFRYCPYHRQFVNTHGSERGKLHTWKKLPRFAGGQEESLKEFIK